MMDEKEEEFLEEKCDEYLQHLICMGTKLAKKGKFNEENFSRTFFPKQEFVLRKIREKIRQEEDKASVAKKAPSCFDSQLIEEIRAVCKSHEKDLDEIAKLSDDSPGSSSKTMRLARECDSPDEKPVAASTAKKEKPIKHDDMPSGDSHFLTQELNYGELSKIFVQKSRVDVVRSKMDKPDFEDHIETIYVYRTRPCCD